MDESVFWLVWNPQGRAPMYRHITKHSATVEAERLARINHGQRFYVLQATDYRELDGMQRVRLDEDQPF